MSTSGKELNRKIWEASYEAQKASGERRYEPFMELIAAQIRRHGLRDVLDFGCGTGNLGWHLKENEKLSGVNLDGVDLTAGALELARPWYATLEQTDGSALPAGKTWDLICINSVIEHVEPEPLDRLLENLRAALRPGGRLFVVVPHFMSPRRILAGRAREWAHEREALGHVNFHRYGTLQGLLARHGFGPPRFSFFQRFRFMRLVGYSRLRFMPGFLRGAFWTLLHLFPFYFLRDSFCLVCVKR